MRVSLLGLAWVVVRSSSPIYTWKARPLPHAWIGYINVILKRAVILRLLPLALLIASCRTAGADATAVGPTEFIDSKTADVSAVLEPIRKKHDLAALAGAVVTLDHLEAQGAVGARKYGDPTPVTVADQFHLGSCTKAMTATLIGRLVDEGKLKWTTTLAQALPELARSMHPGYRKVTIDQLLANRGGMSGESWPKGKSFLQMHQLPGSPMEQRWAYAKLILAEPPAYPAGTKYVYANRGFALLGIIVEHKLKLPWETVMADWLFKPLGITSGGFGAMGTPGKVDEPWQHTMSEKEHIPVSPGPYADNPPIIGPAGTVHCSMADWARFVAVHLRGEAGQDGLVTPATIKHLHTPLFGGDYVAGWVVLNRPWAGGKALMHNGSNTMNYAVVWMAPTKGFAVVIATNQAGTEAENACDEAASALLLRHLKPAP